MVMYPRNFPDPTLKEHFEVFKCNLYFLRIEKTSSRSLIRCLDTYLLFTTISSVKASMFLPS